MSRERLSKWLAFLAILMVLVFGLGAGCKKSARTSDSVPEKPTIRLYVLSTVAGALEPCGCQKDMLGGIDHAAALIEKDSSNVQATLVVGAGPMLFMDPVLEGARKTQDLWKADAIARSFKDIHLAAWAPGANDFAAGTDELRRLVAESGSTLLASNLKGVGTATRIVERAGYRVGLVGVAEPENPAGHITNVDVQDSEKALREALARLKEEKAQIFVALVAAERGRALRLAESVSGFDVFVVGKAFDRGEGNDAPVQPAVIGSTLVVQAPNHLQAVAEVDLYVTDSKFTFVDGSGLAVIERRQSLERRIGELEKRIVEWKRANVSKEDLEARERDLQSLRAQKEQLAPPSPPKDESFFRYDLAEVRERVGSAKPVAERINEYYRRVNEHNRVAFKDRKPEPVAAGQSSYIGVEECANCHDEEHAFWKTTKHAAAYTTLSKEHKEYNLDCVSCHVTGYEKPGGSTVTHVGVLKNVQCEVCHGPGSRHEDDPENADLIIKSPPRTLCVQCHHPPHVSAEWTPDKAWPHILGPGHGTGDGG